MVEHRLAAFHRIEATLDDRPVDPAFIARPAEEIHHPFDRRFAIIQEVLVANAQDIWIGRSSSPSGYVLEPRTVL